MLNRTRRYLSQFGRRELFLLLALLVVAGGAWAFVELADEVVEGEMLWLDKRILRMFRQSDDLAVPIGPAWLKEPARDITALGSSTVLALLTLLVFGFLYLQKLHRAAWLTLISAGSGAIMGTLLKWLIGRPRPTEVPHLMEVSTLSFPSGHSMMSAVVYLTLGALLARLVARPGLKVYVILSAVLVTVLVGVSRVYVGVHYVTDVLAGWTAGTVWATLCWLVAYQLQRRGKVEGEAQEPLPC